jgi:hypothetical protein
MVTRTLVPGTFLIRLKANTDLVLANANGQPRLAWRNSTVPDQLWTLYVSTLASDIFWFVNNGNNTELMVSGDGLVFQDGGDGWEVPGRAAFNAPDVIRNADDDDQNLNALGDGPFDVGSAVGVYAWSGGDDNEEWQITEINYLPNPAEFNWCHFVSGVMNTLQLAVQPNDLAGTQGLKLETVTDDPRFIFARVDWALGFSLRNKLNNKWVCWNGPDQPLTQCDDLCLSTLWTFGSGTYGYYRAVRAYKDDDENMNAYGDGPYDGAVVGTCGWGGGDPNEVWYPVPV